MKIEDLIVLVAMIAMFVFIIIALLDSSIPHAIIALIFCILVVTA